MFLEHLTKFGLIKDPGTNVLNAYPLDSRRIFAQQTVTLLLQETVPWTEISSARFSLECVGQAFNLPVTNDTMPIISGATDLYNKWLFNADGRRPKPVELDEQQFYRVIFGHFSLIFSPKLSNERDADSLENHAKLISAVLTVMRKAILEMGKKFKPETWEELLRVLLGVSDLIFTGKDNPWSLGGRVASLLLQVLLEAFLVSHTKNDALWVLLRAQFANCIERKPTVKHWSNASYALSKRSLRLLYGSSEGADTVTLGGSLLASTLNLQDEFTYYAWYRILYLICPVENIDTPSIYLEVMQGVSQLTTLYLGVGQVAEKQLRATVLDGNSLLNVLGLFLLDGIGRCTKPDHESGKAEGIAALCKVFTLKKQTRFMPKYIAFFYQILEAGLKDETLRPVCIVGCRGLLQTELRGVRGLLPALLSAIDHLYKNNVTTDEKLRAACVHTLSYAVPLGNLYGDMKFSHSPDKRIASYNDLKAIVPQLLSIGARTEEHLENRHALLWASLQFVAEHSADTGPKDLVEFRHSFALQLIAFIAEGTWPTETRFVAVHILADLATVADSSVMNKDFASSVVLQLCVHAVSGLKKEKQDDLLSEIISCITRWCLTSRWLAQSDNAMRKVIALVDSALSTRPSKTAEAADCLLLALLYHLNNWPPATGPNALSSANKETDFADVKRKRVPQMSSYVFDQTILSLYRHPREGNPPNSLTLIAHNTVGRHVWRFGLHFAAPALLPPEHESTFKVDRDLPKTANSAAPTTVEIAHTAVKSEHANILKACQALITEEATIVKKTNYGLAAPTVCYKPSLGTLEEETDATTARLWVSHFGLLSSPTLSCRFPIADATSALRSYDAMKERDTLSVGIIHTRRGARVDAERPSVNFVDFICGLGWRTEQANKRRYCNLESEVTFVSLTSEQAKEAEESRHDKKEKKERKARGEKEDEYGPYDVIITWAEECLELHDFFAGKMSGSLVNIVILPLPSGLYHIRLYRKEAGLRAFGPLVDDASVVSREALPVLVRLTALNAALACRMHSGTRRLPYLARRTALSDLVAKSRVKQSMDEWWAAQFPTARELEQSHSREKDSKDK